MSGTSVKPGFLWVGITFLEESLNVLTLVQEGRVKLITADRQSNGPVSMPRAAALKYGIKGSISQRLNILPV